MKLKTLKDLQWDESGKGDYMVDGNELKEEAIRWVQAHKEQGHQTIKLMLYFHNITEEDLNAK